MALGTKLDRRSALAAIVLTVVAATGFIGCQAPESDNPLLRERVISIDAKALSRFLEHTAQLTGTPTAGYSRRLLDHASSCDELWAHLDTPNADRAPSLASDFSALDCREDATGTSALASLVREHRGEADGFVSWPIGEDGRLELRLDVDPEGGLEIAGTLVSPTEPGGYSMLVPGSEAPAPPAITPSAALVHLRMRPADGIGLSKLIPAGSQADRLFALKGRLLEGALLTGTWELAFMPPAPGGDMPLAIAALHHRLEGPLEEALDEALDQLETTWPIRRSSRPFALATLTGSTKLEGGCFLDLPLLPELAPCWVVTPDALLVGYRGEAIDAALAAPAVSSPASSSHELSMEAALGERAGGRLDVHLDRLARIDEQLLGTKAAPQLGNFFSLFELRMGALGDGRITIHARLRRKP